MTFCPRCAAELGPSQAACATCGATLATAPPARAMVPAGGFTAQFDERAASGLAATAGWMKFIAILFIIGSALNLLSIVILNVPGLVIGGIGLWMAITLLGAATALQGAARGSGPQLVLAHAKLHTFFMVWGILTIILIGLIAIAVLVLLTVGMAMLGTLLGR